MDELVIKTHSFEQSKNQLKQFSEETTTDLDLKKVDSEKGVGEFLGDVLFGRGWGLSHTVTGSEFNSLTTQVQAHLIDINEMQRKFIKEFGQVYSALEALDKDYIQAILIAVKSAQKASGEAKNAQGDIKKTIEEQKKIIKVLQQFKEKLDKYKHIVDIDKMWGEFQTFKSNMSTNHKTINSLEQLKIRLEKYKHLSDIDLIWNNVEEGDKKIASIAEQINGLIEKIQSQAEILSANKEFIKKLNTQEHIYEIDETWQDVEETKNKVTAITDKVEQCITSIEVGNRTLDDLINRMNKLDSIAHLTDVDSLYEEHAILKANVETLAADKVKLEEQNADLSNRMEEEHNKLEEMEMRFANKVKMVYLLAGGAIGMAVIEFLLVVSGII